MVLPPESTVIIAKDFAILPNGKLVIHQSSDIKINDRCRVEGQLILKGTKENPITADLISTYQAEYKYLMFRGSNALLSARGTEFILSDAHWFSFINGATIKAKECIFHKLFWYGYCIWFDTPTRGGRIISSVFNGPCQFLIDDQEELIIKGCEFFNRVQIGFLYDCPGRVKISKSLFHHQVDIAGNINCNLFHDQFLGTDQNLELISINPGNTTGPTVYLKGCTFYGPASGIYQAPPDIPPPVIEKCINTILW